MNPEIVLEKCAVLQVESRSYTDKKSGEPRTYRDVMFRYGGKIFKLGVTKDIDWLAVEGKQDEVCEITVQLSTFGDSLSPDLRISEVN